MSRYDQRLLPASVALAAIVCTSTAILPQSPSTPPSNPPAQQVAASAKPLVQPTPEQLGDALMAHQRYQAAIEAYKKAPTDNADVWNKMGIAYQLMFNLTEAMHCY